MSTHDRPAATSRRAAVRDREDAVVERLQALSTVIDGEPDPAFRAATRQRLVAMAAVRTPAPVPPRSVLRRLLVVRADDSPPARWRGRLTAGLAAAALAVTAVATLVAVSTGARPGDALYGLKRGTEQTQLALAGDARGQTLLDFASTRLTELRALDGSADTAVVVSTLRTMDQQTTEGAAWLTSRALTTRSSAPLNDLSAWASGQQAGVAALQSSVPAGARSTAAGSLGLLSSVAARIDGLSAALGCASGPVTRGTDALGPVPGACVAPTTTGGAGGSSGTPPQAGNAPGSAPGNAPGNVAPTAPAGETPGASGGVGTGSLPGPGGAGSGSLVPGGGPALPTPSLGLPSLPAKLPPVLPAPTVKPPSQVGGIPVPSLPTCTPLPLLTIC